MINQPVQVTVVPDEKWDRVATGLDSLPGKKFTYSAPDFDIYMIARSLLAILRN
jgi:hypothetical protein